MRLVGVLGGRSRLCEGPVLALEDDAHDPATEKSAEGESGHGDHRWAVSPAPTLLWLDLPRV